MHFRCHERQRKKSKTQAVLKSSLKTSTDNLCGPSEEGLKNEFVKQGEPCEGQTKKSKSLL